MANNIEWFIDRMNSQGGTDSDYADVLFGTVVSGSPLKVKISNEIVLDRTFLAVTETAIKAKLKSGDGVVILRGHGNKNSHVGAQQFVVLDKIGG
ncbi:DUF2577 family protein [uncultured Leuconostoc sp.]|uniref:DUF2577 family protein n=1 Tax=uncultured Leuconostoc sp. TaxID=173262 RepID=UPI0025F45E31|nr:DUF2577 family protein [uncultured Leuconostoc sp.]